MVWSLCALARVPTWGIAISAASNVFASGGIGPLSEPSPPVREKRHRCAYTAVDTLVLCYAAASGVAFFEAFFFGAALAFFGAAAFAAFGLAARRRPFEGPFAARASISSTACSIVRASGSAP